MPKVLIVYSTWTGQTKKIAELIAEGARIAGAEVSVVDPKQISSPEAPRAMMPMLLVPRHIMGR